MPLPAMRQQGTAQRNGSTRKVVVRRGIPQSRVPLSHGHPQRDPYPRLMGSQRRKGKVFLLSRCISSCLSWEPLAQSRSWRQAGSHPKPSRSPSRNPPPAAARDTRGCQEGDAGRSNPRVKQGLRGRTMQVPLRMQAAPWGGFRQQRCLPAAVLGAWQCPSQVRTGQAQCRNRSPWGSSRLMEQQMKQRTAFSTGISITAVSAFHPARAALDLQRVPSSPQPRSSIFLHPRRMQPGRGPTREVHIPPHAQQPALQHPRGKRHVQHRRLPPALGNHPCSLFGLKTKLRRSQDQSRRTSTLQEQSPYLQSPPRSVPLTPHKRVQKHILFAACNSLKAPHRRFAPHPQEHGFTKRNKTRRACWLPCQGGHAGCSHFGRRMLCAPATLLCTAACNRISSGLKLIKLFVLSACATR